MVRGEGGPFGAVIVDAEGAVVGRGWNRVLASCDPTAHAEISAIRDACSRLKRYWLTGCRIYATCEPCPMCFGAIAWARLEEIVCAADRRLAAAIGFADDHIYGEVCRPPELRQPPTRRVDVPGVEPLMRSWRTLDTPRY